MNDLCERLQSLCREAAGELTRLQSIEAAVDRSEEFDIAPCLRCGQDCICLAGEQTVCGLACANEAGA